jgi:hypothetical protein
MAEQTTGKETGIKMSEDLHNTGRLQSGTGRGLALFVTLVALLGAMFAFTAPSVMAATHQEIEELLGFEEFDVIPSDTQAGGHPDLTVATFWVSGGPFAESETPFPLPTLKRLKVHTPTGLIGDPHVTPKCTFTSFSATNCPQDSQVGTIILYLFGIKIFFPLYNMVTSPEQAGLLGFTTPLIAAPVFLELSSRTDSDYGLDTVSTDQIRLGIHGLETVLWGVPSNPANDIHRFFTPLKSSGACFDYEHGCPEETFAKSNIPERPFLQAPTVCGKELTSRADLEYYEGYEVSGEAPYPPTTGCQQLSFNPSILAKPTTDRSDTPSGLDLTIKVPQSQSGTTPSSSELRSSLITLPDGFTINPNAADGKVACPDIAANIGTLLAANCPQFSKIASLTLNVSALPGPLPGAIYLAEPKPGDPYRVILAADGYATHVKLLGDVRPDPATGKLTLAFEDLPQSPLAEFDVHVFGSERGLFASPAKCGHIPVQTEFVPWDDELLNSHSTGFMDFTGGPNSGGCPGAARPFSPSIRTGVANSTAGAHSPLSVEARREDGEQNLVGLNVNTPPGFAASLKGIPYCPESALAVLASPAHTGREELAAPACPLASRVGSANTGVGAGNHPFYAGGSVYLAGPYRGAPLSLVVVVPAVSGPYDLGNVVVRSATSVDPTTAQVRTVSDPIPQILQGVPLRLKTILVNLDRPDFALNPTNCEPFTVDTTTVGNEGASSPKQSHFQVANCSSLAFTPKLGLKLRGSTKRRAHPAVRAVLRTQEGESNLRRTVVSMPKNELLDQSHLNNVCTRVQYAANACPASSVYGSATAFTPILDQPLSGPVYLRSSGKGLPDLAVALHGQFDIDLVGKISTTKAGGLRTTFNGIPDAPVSKFVLDLKGGKQGLLVNEQSLCKAAKKAGVKMVGQNGSVMKKGVKLQSGCGSKASKHKRHLRHLRRVSNLKGVR